MATGVKIGTVWDRTTDVLSGRGGLIGSTAILTLFLPSVVQGGISAFVAEGVPRTLMAGLVSLAAAVLTLWGSLVILALATYPATDRTAARRQATARLLPVIGVSLVLMLIVIAILLPLPVILGASGFDFQAAMNAASSGNSAAMPSIPRSAAIFMLAYMLALVVLGFWISARFMLINAVLLNERIGLGALRRSVALTTGLTWKLIGVIMLFVVVTGIAVLAAQSVVGLVFRLILGADQIATSIFLGGVAGAAVTAALLSVAYAFTAQLYVACQEKQPLE